MGQYANQPDFATSAETVVVGTTNVESSALYIGTGGDIEVILVGSSSSVVFKNIPNGSFLPVIVSSIISGANTTVSDIIAVK
jgi:hypothetical protein